MNAHLSSFKTTLFSLFFLLIATAGWGQQTAVYTVSTISAAAQTGVKPTGSSHTYSQTFATAKQITGGNSATLTLSGYAGKRISKITLSMKSNGSSGAGNMSAISGSTTISSIPTSKFNTSDWYGAWSLSYVNVVKTPTVEHDIINSENVVIKINGTDNSLFIDSYSITYIDAAPKFSLSYNGNLYTGGTIPTTQTGITAGANITLANNTGSLVKTGYTLNGWNTVQNGTATTRHALGASYTMPANNVTMYADWAVAATPVITLSNNGTQVAAGNVIQGTPKHRISSFKLDATEANAILTDARFLLSGNYKSTDITAFKLWYNTTNTFSSAAQIGSSKGSTSTGSGEYLDFTTLNQTVAKDAAGYFWLTADVYAGAEIGKTIKVEAINATDFVFASGNKSGSASAAGIQTITENVLPHLLIENIANVNFGNSVCLNTTSAIKGSFDFYGFNLTGNATIGPLTGYTFSIDDLTFTNSLTLAPDGGGDISENIYVKFTPTVAQTYNGNIPMTGGGATATSVAVTGAGIAGAVAVTTTTVGSITTNSAISGGSAVSSTCGTITAKGVVWNTVAIPTIALTTKTNDGTGTGDYSSSITGLVSGTKYFYRAYATNSNGITAYGTESNFTTLCGSTTIPYSENFESVLVPDLPSCTTVINPGAGNIWKTASINANGFSSKVLNYTFKTADAGNTWFFTKGLELTAGVTYQLTYRYGNNNSAFTEKLKVAYGSVNTAAGMTAQLADYTTINQGVSQNANHTFTPVTTGVYYIGFQAYSAKDQDHLYVDDIHVDIAPVTIYIKDDTNTNVASVTFADQDLKAGSPSRTLYVSAEHLKNIPGQITISAPTHFEVSKDDTAWNSSIAFDYTASQLSSTAFYMRFNPQVACEAISGSLTISGGDATKTIALSGKGLVSAPVSTNATTITDSRFTANWSAVENATSYKVNVYKEVGSEVTVFNANFDDVDGTGGNDELWNGAAAPNAATAYTGWSYVEMFKGDQCLKGGTGSKTGSITTPALTNLSGNGTLTFRAGAWDGGSEKLVLNIAITGGGTLGQSSVTLVKGVFTLYTVQITGGTASSKLVFTASAAANNRFFIDDIKVVAGGIEKAPITGSPFTVTAPATELAVTGLDPNTAYFYNVEALVDACSSVKSNEIAVTTLHDTTTYNGTVANDWDFGVPTATIKAVINGDFTTTLTDPVGPLTNLVSKTLTINSGNTLTIAADTSFTTGDFTNNGSLIVKSDGNFVQTAGSINSGAGLATIERNANIKRLDYVYWSSPVANQKFVDFSPKTITTRFLTYNEGTDKFTPVATPENIQTATFVPGVGYAVRAPNDHNYPAGTAKDWLGVFTGQPNNGDISFALQYQSGTVGVGNGYNLVGNPYPSNIVLDGDAGLFQANNGKIGKIAYFWNNSVPNVGELGPDYTGENYAVYNKAGGTPATGSTDKPDGVVKLGQGFIVQALTAGNTLTFTNSMRDGSLSSDFYDRKESEPKDRFWLQLTTPNQDFNTLLVAYVPAASNAFEVDYDAPMMGMSSDALFSVLGDQKLSIQGRQYPLDPKDVVSLGSNHYVAGNHVISLQQTEGIFANGQNIYLKDNQTNTVTNLSAENYTFAANEGLTEGRFEILYKDQIVLGTGNASKDDLIVYRDGTDFIVKSATKKISEVEVYDTSGRLVLKLNPNQTEVRIDGSAMINGVYVLKVNRNGEVNTKKITK